MYINRLQVITAGAGIFYFYIHRNPIEMKVPMVERLQHYPYSSFPLYWADLLLAPFEKTNAAYDMYCLTYAQNAKGDVVSGIFQ